MKILNCEDFACARCWSATGVSCCSCVCARCLPVRFPCSAASSACRRSTAAALCVAERVLFVFYSVSFMLRFLYLPRHGWSDALSLVDADGFPIPPMPTRNPPRWGAQCVCMCVKSIIVSALLILSMLTFLCLVFRPVNNFMRIRSSELCIDRCCAGMGHSISFSAVVLLSLLLLFLLLSLLLLSSWNQCKSVVVLLVVIL